MHATQITLFGSLEVRHGQAPPQRPSTYRVLSLLGYLITHHDTPQSRDKLVDLLFPDLAPRQGRRMLSDTLWRARRLLVPPGVADAPGLTIAGDTVSFRPGDQFWVDLIAFERRLQPLTTRMATELTLDAAAMAGLREAVEFYRGDFLEECYDDWALYERERLRELYLSALQALLTYDQQRQAYDSALLIALRLVRADPLREHARRELMRLYYLLGREADALRAFEQCCVVLADELGVEPDTETRSLYEEIVALQRRRNDTQACLPASAADHGAIARQLPFVGRHAQRAEVMDAVEQAIMGGGGIVLVGGVVGIGKSRLLHEVATGAQWRGAQVSWGRGCEDAQAIPFGALREALGMAITPLRARELAALVPAQTLAALVPLLPQLAELLPQLSLVAPQPDTRQPANLHAAIAQLLLALGQIVPQVILLDDMHRFDPATLQALGTLPSSLAKSRVLLVISGRLDELARRQIAWSALLQLDRAGLLRRVELGGLAEDECTELVRRALRMRQGAVRFSARLCRATDGNPFFILETLRWLQEQGKLTRDDRGIWHTPWDAPGTDYSDLPLPPSLRDAIGERLRELPLLDQAALAAAAVLGQTFTPITWSRMADTDVAPSQEALRRHFLIEDDVGYRFVHNTLREVIYDSLDDRTRCVLHLRAAQALEHEHYARVEALAQHLYLARAWEKALPYLIQAGDRAHVVCAWQDALHCYNQAIEAAAHALPDLIEPSTVWNVHLKRGETATLLGDYPTGLAAYEEALRLTSQDELLPAAASRAGARRSAQMEALNGLIYIYGQRNDYALAREVIQQAMELASESPRLLDRAEVYYQAGSISFRLDDYAEAQACLEQARELYEALDNAAGLARCWCRLAWIWLRLDGATDRVVSLLERARSTFHELDARYHEHDSALALANVWLWRGALPEAICLIEACLSFFTDTATRDKVAEAQIARAEALRRMGRYGEARVAVREAYAIHVELARPAAAQYDQIVLGNLLRDLGQYTEARKALDEALRTEDRLNKARALVALAELNLCLGDVKGAFQQAREALLMVRRLQARAQVGVALRVLGQTRAAADDQLPPPTHDAPGAELCFQESVRLLESARYEGDLGLTYARYGEWLIARGRSDEACPLLTRGLALLQRCAMTTLAAPIQQALLQLAADVPTLVPGQVRVRLPRRGTPRGRPLRPDEFAEVLWTVESEEDAARVGGKAVARQSRIRRLCAEASAQGAEPTINDLASALGVTARTVDRDIAALRAAGEVVVTRGGAV